jgi:transcription initiation factor TFIIIB Brf1 subunit/transcription initiation factor TFIIB
MRNCPNCGAQITCGCQDRVASDGKKVCSNCVALYEQQLVNQNQSQNENVSTQQS